MANQFYGNPDEPRISWSNGLTGVLLDRIAVAAAQLCQTEREYEFARWIATRDQRPGRDGWVGFDLADIPWGTPEELPDRKRFVVEAMVHAASREVAYRLPYYPNPEREDVHRECLRQFALMVHRFNPTRSDRPPATAWPYLFAPTAALCERHRLFRHELGCMVCPDEDGYTVAGSRMVRPG